MSQETFPVEDVESSLRDRELQDRSLESLDSALRDVLECRRREAIAEGASEKADWMYFRSPRWTWEELCGREGWLLYDRDEKRQYAFLLTVMN